MIKMNGMIKAAAAALLLSAVGVQAADKPLNVIFILADDLGWSDTTLYGTTKLYQTPNLERLAQRGMLFTRAYANSPLCSPTRASILTGQTPARHGSTQPKHHTKEVRLKAAVEPSAPAKNKATGVKSVTRLNTTYPTLGKLMKQAGYSTAHFGKWHLGPEPYSPLQHGFDVDLPHHPGPGPAGSFVAPWKFRKFKANYPGEHIEDRMAEETIDWMASVPKEKPFFISYWQFSVHAPFDAKKELIEKYRKKIDPKNPQKSPTYAAMVHSLDDAVGSLLDAVDKKGVADRTVIVFISDNGGNMYSKVQADGGVVPTSNSPLRGGKASMYEGGIRVPCVVVWPGVTEPGSRSDEIIQTSDFYPTLLNGLGVDPPKKHKIDGIDIMPALKGNKLDREAIFTYFPHSPPVPEWLPPSMSVHSGDWKLIRIFHGGENGAHDYRLYNLAEDIGEKNNLAASHPEKVRMLDRMIENHIKETGAVVPQPNPDFDPKLYKPENIGLPPDQWKSSGKSGEKSDGSGAVDGWVPGKESTLSQKNGRLVLESTGKSSFGAEKFARLKGGPFTLKFRMKSNASGRSSVFYNKPSLDTLIRFPMKHDGLYHEYAVNFPVNTLKGLRFNPSKAEGTIEVDWIRILDNAGTTVRSWDF